MTPERWQRIEQLYHEALQHKAGERLAQVRHDGDEFSKWEGILECK
jgi:hypothetical protein